MTELTTAPRSKDSGLTVRIMEYLQQRPGVVVNVDTLMVDCGLNGEPARRGSVQRAVGEYAARNPQDINIVASGLAWSWRGAPAMAGVGSMIIIRMLADGSALLEGPGGKLYHARAVSL